MERDTTRGYDFSDLADIPGTPIFTIASSRRAYHLHRFCMSLMQADNRAVFQRDEAAYLAGFAISPEQRDAVLGRDYKRMIELGGNIFFLLKIASTDGRTTAQTVSTMTEFGADDYVAMMVAGGRSPEGIRSIKGKN